MSELQKLISQQDCTVESFKKTCTEKGLTVKDWKERLLITYPNHRDSSNTGSNTERCIDYTDPFVRQCRGVILQKEPLQVVCYSMDKFYHADDFSAEELKQHFESVDTVEELLDGSLVKLYWFNDQWTVATNRCIEARKARWANYRSFYELFQDAVNATKASGTLDYEKLNKRRTYSFVLCHPENRIVANYPTPKIVHVATRDLDTLEEVSEDIGVERPLALKMDWETFQKRLRSNPYYMPGYLIRTLDGKRIVVECDKYIRVKELKGNSPDLIYRYLQLQRENEAQFKEFLTYFPEFTWIDSQLETLAREAHRTYIEFFVNRNKSRINRDLWELMSELHTLYLRTKEPTSLVKVRQHLKSYPLDKLARLMKMKTH